MAVGSNIENRTAHLEQARTLLMEHPEIHWQRSSEVHETDPVGPGLSGQFLNAVWEIRTCLSPYALLDALEAIQRKMGRATKSDGQNRTIDLDIALFGSLMMESKRLVIPHPRMHERAFVLKPLAELVPHFFHPKLGKTVQELLEEIVARS